MKLQLTKLEKYVDRHPNMTWENMADRCGTTPAAMMNAFGRLERKRRAAREAAALVAARDHNAITLPPVPGWSDFCKSMGCNDAP